MASLAARQERNSLLVINYDYQQVAEAKPMIARKMPVSYGVSITVVFFHLPDDNLECGQFIIA